MAIKVTLRQKPISKGRKSLYLDFYPPISIMGSDKTTRREFLGLYIFDKPKNPLQRESKIIVTSFFFFFPFFCKNLMFLGNRAIIERG